MSQKGIFFAWCLVGLTVLLTAACGGGDTTPTNTPTPTPASNTTPAPGEIPDQVLALISPSLAFISTPTTSGSAILIDGGYLLTNAHIVHGFDDVQVVFPDGSAFEQVPVKNSDDLIDLAVLGPIDTGIGALKLHDREDLGIGSEVYLVGYPAEAGESPQPAINRGILSRVREWEALGMTYLQTDAAVTGGQSGGALVSERGEIIGISGLRVGNAEFGLVASAADLAPLAEALIEGKGASVLGSRRFILEGGQREHQFALANPWDIRTFLIDEPVGTNVEVQLDGTTAGLFTALNPAGTPLVAGDSGTPGLESAAFSIATEGRHIVSVGLSAGAGGEFTISGDVNLFPANDPDDGIAISLGDLVAGDIDFIGDVDYFLVDLEEGETVEIRVESMNIDASLTVDFPDSQPDQVLLDNDGGGGTSGTDPRIFYRPIRSGVHYVVVNDAGLVDTGGYFVSVKLAPDDATAAHIPTSFETVDTPFGLMIAFESPTSGFSALAPSDWRTVTDRSPGMELNLVNVRDSNMIIVVGDLTSLGLADTTLDEYSDLVIDLFTQQIPGFELLSQERVPTTQGPDAVRIDYLARSGDFHGSRLIYVDENNKVINISFQNTIEEFEALNEMIDYIFASLKSE